ncbi:sigma-70 family RNA polymerase sigma factor [Caproiciproducens galactitolivorans]|uniref:RNA polymerase sigma factor SigO n=1 Tax=Caproiciproducens galactitolivorans TaxID=642589 RepID=A0A4Z0XVP8_9FIRM|nr:sigma factor-like helix-turn-helix DNA-binding protein [Caproiciproducens galactitolivorans]QEY33722.1 sigma-70 family RNA polymerase sigma factor [Caproiciproducens galactitolivorans]TGJ75499.1 RNA polymerase sigma factor SigO [Caproiciproducens galactitolivorans]
MTSKEFLQQYQDANRQINAKLDQIHRLRELATKTTQSLIPDRVQSSAAQDKVSVIVGKIVDMEHEVDLEIDHLQEIKHKIEVVIQSVTDAKQRAVLTRRYINGQTWEQIAVDLNISYQWVCELHGRALQKISEQLIEVDTPSVV